MFKNSLVVAGKFLMSFEINQNRQTNLLTLAKTRAIKSHMSIGLSQINKKKIKR